MSSMPRVVALVGPCKPDEETRQAREAHGADQREGRADQQESLNQYFNQHGSGSPCALAQNIFDNVKTTFPP